MSSPEYSRIKALFKAAVELEPEEWRGYLDRECADDPEVRSQVEELLRHHQPDTVLLRPEPGPDASPDSLSATVRFRDDSSQDAEGRRRRAVQRRTTIGVVAAFAVMLGIGLLLFSLVRSSLQTTLETGFQALASRSVEIAKLWLEGEESRNLDEDQNREECLLSEDLRQRLEPEIGATGDVYVFDGSGRKCSKGRYQEGDEAEWTFPGITAGAPTSGTDMDGYRSYHGTEVVGAWIWVDELERGVVVEAQTSQVYAPLTYIFLAFFALLVLLLLLSGLAFAASVRAESLEQAVAEGERLGQYTLLERIGEGGLGVVYEARHERLRRPTAVKLLKSNAVTPQALRRFEREVQQTANLTHPNTIAVYDYGRSDSGTFYYAMEYLSGITIGQLLKREETIPIGRTLYILRQVLGSLREAHSVGLIHRDIKPANVMINHRGGRYDVVKVLDFGLAKEIDPGPESDITERGLIGGTALYIAPERLNRFSRPDGRSDLYAVGVMGYLMLTGREPYAGETPVEICAASLSAPTPRISDVRGDEIPPEVDDVFFACMAKEPDGRPPNAGVLEASLTELQQRYPWTQEDAAEWWRRNAELDES